MSNFSTELSLARQHYQSGKLGEAETLCRQVLDAEPGHIEALFLLGAVYHAQGRMDDSLANYREAVRLKPDFAEAFTNLSHVLAALGRQEESIACYQQGLLLDYQRLSVDASVAVPVPVSETADALNDRGLFLMRQGRLEEARACWQQALRYRELPEVHNNLGLLCTTQKEWDTALASYRRALALRPDYPDALNNLGIVLFQTGQVEDAVRCFRQALALHPDSALALKNLGNAMLLEGKLDEAVAYYRKVLSMQPNHLEVLNYLGIAYAGREEWDEARRCFDRSLALCPNDPQTHRQRGHAFLSQGNDVEALRCYKQALALNPDESAVQHMVEVLSGKSPSSRVPADYVAAQFDSYADTYDQDLIERLSYRVPEYLTAALSPAPAEPNLDVLDLGCGTGLSGVKFRAWARTLIGVDLSPLMLERARKRGVYDELMACELLTVLQSAEERFDLILAGDVFVYLGDLEPVFHGVRRALRPGGRFAFSVELLKEGTFRLRPAFRFAHSRAYLRDLAQKSRLQEVCMNPEIIRTEFGQGVAGLIVVFSRS